MDPNTLLVIMAVFTGVAALALVIQAGMLIGIYKSSKAVGDQVAKLAPKIEALAETSKLTLEESRVSLKEITTRTTDILDTTRRQLSTVEDLLDDVSSRAKVQFDRAELVVDDAMTRTQETIAVVHGGIMKPLREINGIAAGLRAALQYFMRGNRPQPDQATVDEEMFI
ncbi:MAG TPA: hypothetical protein VGN17_23900 [Bryobacteraceae bacterium]|jgi:hypothetical protein